jgi:hypothetical protein
MRVEVHIDRLVLEGIPQGDGAAIAAALERRLDTLLSAAPVAWTDADRVDGGQFAPGTTPAQTGQRIAAAVYAGLSR